MLGSLRLVTVGIVIAALYVLAPLSKLKEYALTTHLANLYTWMASGLFMTLVWYELHNQHAISIAVVWTLFAVLLFELGMIRPSQHLRLQGYAAMGVSFARIFFVNLNPAEVSGSSELRFFLDPRFYTVIPLAAVFYYVSERLEASAETDPQFASESGFRIAHFTSFFGLITLAAIMRVVIDPEQVIVGWSMLVFALMVTAWARKRLIF